MKPVLFNTEMVRAILEGRKTQTRSLIKPQPIHFNGRRYIFDDATCPKKWEDCYDFVATAPYQPGDTLYVRETWNRGYIDASDAYLDNRHWFEEHLEHDGGILDESCFYIYRADFDRADEYDLGTEDDHGNIKPVPWHPSIYMPKEAARIFLRVTDVRVERLHKITEHDAMNEGCQRGPSALAPYVSDFIYLWDSTIRRGDLSIYGWDANPFVWVYSFKRISKEEAMEDGLQ